MIKEQEHPFALEVVSIRMVKDAPFYSDKPIDHPKKVVELLAKELCDLDREVMYEERGTKKENGKENAFVSMPSYKTRTTLAKVLHRLWKSSIIFFRTWTVIF